VGVRSGAMSSPLRHVPSVEKLIHTLGHVPGVPRPMVAHRVKAAVAQIREYLIAGNEPESFETVAARLGEELERLALSRLRPVINGTGVILHTNLGRAPLGLRTGQCLAHLAEGYCNLEIDLTTGDRGHRGAFVEEMLAVLCGAAAATAVNNCAAALVLILRELTSGERKEVIISRSELVEIGGGFRIPEIMETSGACLKEVGATNKTTLRDYERAIGPRTALILKVHRSNFFMEGFTEWPELSALAELARTHGLPLVEDLGSGAMEDTLALNTLEHEPLAAESLAAGADLVCVSGDKLFGGPQAGIIAGRADLVKRLKREPFFRALRCDKLILAALQETATAYLERHGTPAEVPVVDLLRLTVPQLETRGTALLERLQSQALTGTTWSLGRGISRCGGGTMPKSAMESITLDLTPLGIPVDEIAHRLRTGSPSVVGYVESGRLRLDLRTIFPWQEAGLVSALAAATHPAGGES
jgi:L-seryl-tRNA(Ser) seleniumtransferase